MCLLQHLAVQAYRMQTGPFPSRTTACWITTPRSAKGPQASVASARRNASHASTRNELRKQRSLRMIQGSGKAIGKKRGNAYTIPHNNPEALFAGLLTNAKPQPSFRVKLLPTACLFFLFYGLSFARFIPPTSKNELRE